LNNRSLIVRFEERLDVRGRSFCEDDSHKFSIVDKYPFRIHDVTKIIHKPRASEGVTELQWVQNFDLERPESRDISEKIFKAIADG
jgi:hypothetical protein